MSGVAMQASKSIQPPAIFSTMSSPPTTSAPACFGFLDLVAGSNHANLLGFAKTMRQNNGAANHLIGMLRIDAQPHVNFDGLVELRKMDLLQQAHRVRDRVGTLLQPAFSPLRISFQLSP